MGHNAVMTFDPAGKLVRAEHAIEAGNDGIVILPDGTKYVSSVRFGSVSQIRPEDQGRLYQSPITAAELAPLLDIAFITHKHGDHFNRKTAHVLAEKGTCIFVMPANCVEDARSLGIPETRIQVATPRKPLELKGVKVSPLRAIHGNSRSAVYFDANLDDFGYLIQLGNTTFLQPGDSVLHLKSGRSAVARSPRPVTDYGLPLSTSRS
jgi:L-ascorbate metabolism protein UlaG (beta-lactamase superfamily)